MKIKKWFRYATWFYFGAALTLFANISITDWQWWVIVVPIVFGIGFTENYENRR